MISIASKNIKNTLRFLPGSEYLKWSLIFQILAKNNMTLEIPMVTYKNNIINLHELLIYPYPDRMAGMAETS
jgi:hypothetical protein